ncbi:MAG: Crp/Fnr family transcriptional regulator [Candidatus Aminicenantes bacterium]|nr:Crp/Fnr family transcriptional regulator [Candidatus Aminicenantes bacterium]
MVEIKTLGALELFEGLPDKALEAVAAIAEERRYAAGAIIFSPEQSSDWAFLLLAGSVRLTVHASSLPQPMTVAVLETPGQAFGFSTIIGQQHHNSSAEAVADVRAVAIHGPKFLEYLEKDPEVGFVVMRRVAKALSRRLATLRRVLLDTVVDYETPASTIPEN